MPKTRGFDPLVHVDTYRGVPVDAITKEILQERELEAARAKQPKPSAQELRDMWDPATHGLKGAPGKISEASARALEAMAKEPDIEHALAHVKDIAELAPMARVNGGTLPIFQRAHQIEPPTSAALAHPGYERQYANLLRMAVVAGSGDATALRLQVIAHFAGAANDYQWTRSTGTVVDKRLSSHWWSIGAAKPQLVAEALPTMTPAELAASIKSLLENGETTIDRTSR